MTKLIWLFFIQELREAFEAESKSSGKSCLLLTIAMPAGQEYIDQGFDVPKIAKYAQIRLLNVQVFLTRSIHVCWKITNCEDYFQS